MIPGTSKMLSKYGPGDLLTITKMAQKIQENYGIILETYYVCQSGTHKILDLFEHVCPMYHACLFSFRCLFVRM